MSRGSWVSQSPRDLSLPRPSFILPCLPLGLRGKRSLHRPGRIFPGQSLTDPGLEIGGSLQAGDVSCPVVSVASRVVLDLGGSPYTHLSPRRAALGEPVFSYLARLFGLGLFKLLAASIDAVPRVPSLQEYNN